MTDSSSSTLKTKTIKFFGPYKPEPAKFGGTYKVEYCKYSEENIDTLKIYPICVLCYMDLNVQLII